MKITPFQPGTYVLAISGGVDSMVLLDSLMKIQFEDVVYVIAHVNHGIRPDAREDLYLVEQVARKHALPVETTQLLLGKNASELQARELRHDFFRSIRQKYNARAIVTAHHQSDVVETALINLQRGTGWRGIASLRETADYKRPLLEYTKEQLYAHARAHGLSWHEDSTNTDIKYRRNEIRHKLLPLLEKSDPDFLESFHTHIQRQVTLRHELEAVIDTFSRQLVQDNQLTLSLFRQLDGLLATEVLRWYLGLENLSLTRPQLERLCDFVMKAHRNQKHSLGKNIFASRRGGFLVVEKG